MIDMPVNLENLLRQAATCIDPKKDRGAYAYMIGEEVADHIAQERSGEIPPVSYTHLTLPTICHL